MGLLRRLRRLLGIKRKHYSYEAEHVGENSEEKEGEERKHEYKRHRHYYRSNHSSLGVADVLVGLEEHRQRRESVIERICQLQSLELQRHLSWKEGRELKELDKGARKRNYEPPRGYMFNPYPKGYGFVPKNDGGK